MMRKFWMFVGGAYVLIRRNMRIVTPLLLIALVLVQFSFLAYLSVKVSRIEKKVKADSDSSLQVMNRIYSQVWLLNNRVNSVLEKK
jgi:hypothetical protein